MGEVYGSEMGIVPDWLQDWDIPQPVKMLAETAVYSQLVLTIRKGTVEPEGPSAEERGLVTHVPRAAERAEVTRRLAERHTRLLADLTLQYSLPDGRSWGDEVQERMQAVFLPETTRV